MSSNPLGVPKRAERATSWKIPEGATHYVSPLPTEPYESDWQSESYSDVDFYKERLVCGDPSRKTWCRWSSSKKMFMYVEQDKPRELLSLPQNVLHTHLLKSAYHVVVNGE